MSNNGKPRQYEQIIACSNCGRKIPITLDLDDKQYLQDILEELGWFDHLCPECQDLRKV